MANSAISECIICSAPNDKDFEQLCTYYDANGLIQLSEIASMYRDLLQLTIIYYTNTTLYLCKCCAETIRNFNKFKIKATESYKRLFEIPAIHGDFDQSTKETIPNQNSLSSGIAIKPYNISARSVKLSIVDSEMKEIEDIKVEYDGDEAEKEYQPIRTEDDSNRAVYQCTECDILFKEEEDLKYHMMLHVNQTFECDYCPMKFSSAKACIDHLGKHVNKKMKPPYKCIKCPEVIGKRAYFIDHLAYHTIAKECDRCDKVFYNKILLDEHIKMKHDEFYICCVCNESFSWLKQLQEHKRQFNCSKYKCNICTKSFPFELLKDHYSSIHNRKVEVIKVPTDDQINMTFCQI